MSRYLVIGSGLIGRLTAWRLIQAGHQVSILSKDDRQGSDSAGYVAASMVAPATEAISAEPMVKTVGLRSYELWPEWLKELAEPVFYQNSGTLVVAHNGDQAEMARFQRRASHVLEDSDFRLLDRQALADREPELADNFGQALLFEQESCLDNRQFYQRLGELLAQECDWQQTEEISELNQAELERVCQEYLGVKASVFDSVLDCRGNGGKANLSNLRSVRGEVIRVYAPEVNFTHAVRLMHPRYPFYLAPRPNHEYVLGATVIESDDRSAVTVRSGLEMTAHCRPGLPDNMPTIKRTDWGYIVNGFYRHGYLFGPAVVADLTALLAGKTEQVQFGALYDV